MNNYGCQESNPLPSGYHENVTDKLAGRVPWTEPGLRVTRLRLITDPGFPVWDVSYCHGRLADGTFVEVDLPFDQLPRRGLRKAIVGYAKKDKVFAKGMGILDNISTLC